MTSRPSDAVKARELAATARGLRRTLATLALEVAETMEHRAATLEAMGAPEDRIREVRDLAASERRVAADWTSEATAAPPAKPGRSWSNGSGS